MTALTPTETRYSLADHAKALAVILGEEFGIPFTFHDAATGAVVESSLGEAREASVPPLPPEVVLQHAHANRRQQLTLQGGRYELVLPLPVPGKAGLIAIGTLSALAHTPAESAQEQARLGKWVQSF